MKRQFYKKKAHLDSRGQIFAKFKRLLIIMVPPLLLITSCSSGDSSSEPTQGPVASSNWDTMRWDLDNWQ